MFRQHRPEGVARGGIGLRMPDILHPQYSPRMAVVHGEAFALTASDARIVRRSLLAER